MEEFELEKLRWIGWDELVKIKPKFPHYKPIETKIMRKFIDDAVLIGDYAFDVRLRPPERPLYAWETIEDYRIWMILKSLRIDAIVRMFE